MNKWIGMGRLTRDPDIRYSQGTENMAIANFTIAIDRRVKPQGGDQTTADFIPCVCFGKKAEFVEKYLKQGTKVTVSGEIRTESYTNKDGQKIYTTKAILDDIEFAESKANSAEQNSSKPSPSNAGKDGFMNIPDGIDEELPFN